MITKILSLLFLFAIIRNGSCYKYEVKYIEQKVDHFGYANQDTFQQRYFVNHDYFDPKNGSVFFYTGNEGDIEMFCNNSGFIWENAAEFNALIVFAEHRYYGQSLPYGDKSYLNNKYLGYLTSEQALADFAVLMEYLRLFLRLSSHRDVPMIAFGGSYGGMLAAWIRMKYPHLVNGAVASSAPIFQFLTPCERYNEIITQDFVQADANCAESIKRSWSVIRNYGQTEIGAEFLTKTFNLCKPLNNDTISDLIQWLYDTWSYMAMTDYPYPTEFLVPLPAYPINEACNYLRNPSESNETLIANIFKAASVFQNYTGTVQCFDVKKSGGSSLGVKGWNYQACSEMVMPMCQTGVTDMFEPQPWDFNEFTENCIKMYNVEPDMYKPIIMYGGKNITSSSNIIFTNGKLDPWSGGGVLKSLSDTLIAIQIDKAAHHLDLRSSNPDDPLSVKKARAMIKSWIHKWTRQ